MSLFYKYIQRPNFILSNDLKSLAIVLLWIVLLITINYLIVQIYRKEFLKL